MPTWRGTVPTSETRSPSIETMPIPGLFSTKTRRTRRMSPSALARAMEAAPTYTCSIPSGGCLSLDPPEGFAVTSMVHAEEGTSMGTGERAGSPELVGGGDGGTRKTTGEIPVGFGPAVGDEGAGDVAHAARKGRQTKARESER